MKVLRAYDYQGRGGVDLGVRRWRWRRLLQGLINLLRGRPWHPLVGFELNARRTAVEAVQIAQHFFNMPFEDWQAKGYAALSLDHFNLKRLYDFMSLSDQLSCKRGWMATLTEPDGIVFSIPPKGSVAGIVILSRLGHKDCVKRYEALQGLVGGVNDFDYPLYQ